ncbi:hypothetical protein [Microbacterium sp. NPDC076911]|uniref:hypothetical protein n=1 Tax=Microbacterium sp. NPDC076911 TaxID=3154958 RepID=UPI00343EEB24
MTADRPTRRIELTMHKPWFVLYGGVRPTLIIEGRGQPVQWGAGTWQLAADEPVTLGVFLFNRIWRFGEAQFTLAPDDPAKLIYEAPMWPFIRGRMRLR